MEDLILVFKALSDPIRLEILKTLYITEESTCVCELVNAFSIPQSKLSYHLKLLLSANLITKTSVGKWNHYSANKETLNSVLSPEAINILLKEVDKSKKIDMICI